ncbi:hypothetical protein L596_004169 [Steinernema carpocapsae]|uniref:C-type lectin domain-containing protein n=1 Tax=Steinernema carpocapsae TaxID=34508 RepID=A0A4U8UUW5_STECR|nr:hypothetical protein L596_004169 [Steinernema carpocapsae]
MFLRLSPLLLLVSVTSAIQVLPHPTAKAEKDGPFVYQYFFPRFTWSQAESYCRSLRGSLVSIHNDKEQRQAERQLSATGAVTGWIGARFDSTGLLVWSDRSRWNYNKWRPGNPVPSNRISCIYMTTDRNAAGWGNTNCQTRLPFVCQIPRK